MTETNILIHEAPLRTFVTELFSRVGMADEHATFHAKALVDTNLKGIDSHGVLRVPIYIQRLRSGAVNPSPNIQTIQGALAFEVLDGDHGAGFIVARAAMQRAIELAQQFNVGVVGAIHSNHFGAAGIYTELAAEQGMIGIAMTNVVPNVVAPGGAKPITGNNPLAVAVPTYGKFPFSLDISLSSVAGGKLLLASKQGQKIPLDWATDSHGRPTDDPTEAFKGFLLPAGGFKGLGLSYVVDILSGLITGGVFQHGMRGMYKYPDDPSLTGHFMLALNIDAVMSREELTQRMQTYYDTIKASPMWDEQQEMMLPGEIEYRTMQTRQQNGIPLPENLYNDLVALGQELGVETTLESVS